MRILVTNDDGVHAPGLAAMTRALVARSADPPGAEPWDVVVAAPLTNHSGASASVGSVFERESIAYRRAVIEGAEGVPAFGLDAAPALSVIVAALGGFGPVPDVVVSGINHGVNVGRSILHSGTVGAALTGAQLGLPGLAVSVQSGRDPEHWDTAAALAVELVALVAAAPPGTVLNLNAPALPLDDVKGVRRGRVSNAGVIKSVEGPMASAALVTHGEASGAGAGAPGEEGSVRLRLGAAVPSLGDVADEAPDDDGALVAAGYASLTAVRGVREDTSASATELVQGALDRLATSASSG